MYIMYSLWCVSQANLCFVYKCMFLYLRMMRFFLFINFYFFKIIFVCMTMKNVFLLCVFVVANFFVFVLLCLYACFTTVLYSFWLWYVFVSIFS